MQNGAISSCARAKLPCVLAGAAGYQPKQVHDMHNECNVMDGVLTLPTWSFYTTACVLLESQLYARTLHGMTAAVAPAAAGEPPRH